MSSPKEDPRVIVARLIIAAIRIQRNVRAFKYIRDRDIEKLRILLSASGAFQKNSQIIIEETEELMEELSKKDDLNDSNGPQSITEQAEPNLDSTSKLDEKIENSSEEKSAKQLLEEEKLVKNEIDIAIDRLWSNYNVRSIDKLTSTWGLDTADYELFERYQKERDGLTGSRVGEAWMLRQDLLGFSEYQAEQIRRSLLNYKTIETEQQDAAHLINNLARQRQARKRVASIREERQEEENQQHKAATKLQGIARQREAKKQLGEKKELAVDFHIIEVMDDMIMKIELREKGIDIDNQNERRAKLIENTLGRAAVLQSRLSLKMFSRENIDTPESSTNRSSFQESGFNTPSFSDMHSTAPGTPFTSNNNYSGGVNTPFGNNLKVEERLDKLEALVATIAMNTKHLVKRMEELSGQPVTPPSEDDMASLSGLSVDSQARLELLLSEKEDRDGGDEEDGAGVVNHRRSSLGKKDLSETNERELSHALKYSSRDFNINKASKNHKQLSPIASRCISESVDMSQSLDGGGSLESSNIFITDEAGNIKRPFTAGSPPYHNAAAADGSKKKLNLQAEKYKYYVPPQPARPAYYTVEERRLFAKQKHDKEHAELVALVKEELKAEEREKSGQLGSTPTSPSKVAVTSSSNWQPTTRSRSSSPVPISKSSPHSSSRHHKIIPVEGGHASKHQPPSSTATSDSNRVGGRKKNQFKNSNNDRPTPLVQNTHAVVSGKFVVDDSGVNSNKYATPKGAGAAASSVLKQKEYIPMAERHKKHNPQADKYVGYVPPPVEAPTYKSKEERRQAAKELHEKKKLLNQSSSTNQSSGLLPAIKSSGNIHARENMSREGRRENGGRVEVRERSKSPSSSALIMQPMDRHDATQTLHSYEEEEDNYSLNGHMHNIDQREFYDDSRLKHIREKQYKYADYQPPQPELSCHTKQDIKMAARSLHEKLSELRDSRPKSSDRRKRLEQSMIDNGNALNTSLNSETIRNLTYGSSLGVSEQFSQTQ